MAKFDIWDIHCHLNGVAGRTPEERLDKLLEYAKRVGLARLCVFMGMEWAYDPAPEKMRQDNEEVLRAIRRAPGRAFGFVYLNPRHTQASLDELNRCVRDGPMIGVKLWVAQHCNARALDPLIERATELKAIVYQHTWLKVTGNLPGESTPMDLAELAARHPKAALVCGHSGGDWELGLRAIRPHQNLFAELGGGDPTAGFTEMAVRELGAERVLYGSDAGGRSFASQLAKVLGADIPDPAKRLVLGGNLRRLLRPILKEKGINL
ncbi:MAG: amidohydrolase family protein [Verrucomicrobia bacterium]|nr:amidohydrolase family protein [Verrucomicrobiota bacterium]